MRKLVHTDSITGKTRTFFIAEYKPRVRNKETGMVQPIQFTFFPSLDTLGNRAFPTLWWQEEVSRKILLHIQSGKTHKFNYNEFKPWDKEGYIRWFYDIKLPDGRVLEGVYVTPELTKISEVPISRVEMRISTESGKHKGFSKALTLNTLFRPY